MEFKYVVKNCKEKVEAEFETVMQAGIEMLVWKMSTYQDNHLYDA